MGLPTILLIAAFILFLLATLGIPDAPRFRIIAAGLSCWVLSTFVGGLH